MSAKSKSSRKNIRRPFDPAILERARKIADTYRIAIEFEDGEYYGYALELTGAMGDGKTPDECIKATREAATVVVAYMIEEGQSPPLPAREGVRTEQVNVRLSIDEKVAIESAAKQMGFRGISDYIRSAAIAGFGK
ncbi:MAG: type II toxin-antitoxin system HicB family antitoxin [Tepidisphaeraceae bacterium]|jgi:predicted RNase H-like HicB family nuclease